MDLVFRQITGNLSRIVDSRSEWPIAAARREARSCIPKFKAEGGAASEFPAAVSPRSFTGPVNKQEVHALHVHTEHGVLSCSP